MKQGARFKLEIGFATALDEVQRIEFKFVQGATSLRFSYPSAVAQRKPNSNIVELLWTAEQTWMFRPGPVKMDTLVTMKYTDLQPDTNIVTLDMVPTLFTKQEVNELG